MDKSLTAIHRIPSSELAVVTTERIWQEYLCHESAILFDRVDEELLLRGQRFECLGCRRWHTAGIDGPTRALLDEIRRRSGELARPDGELEYRPLPADAAERRAWLEEAVSWNEVLV